MLERLALGETEGRLEVESVDGVSVGVWLGVGVDSSEVSEDVDSSVGTSDEELVVLVVIVPLDPPTCLFANSIRLWATSAFCLCTTSIAVLSSGYTPC